MGARGGRVEGEWMESVRRGGEEKGGEGRDRGAGGGREGREEESRRDGAMGT